MVISRETFALAIQAGMEAAGEKLSLEDVARLLQRIPSMHTIHLHQNNSGGYFWLSDEQFDALLADGWRVASGLNFGGRAAQDLLLDVPVADERAAITIAQIEFQRVTGEDPNAIGCTCCGPPFHFDIEDE
jgi:hypothetical protein